MIIQIIFWLSLLFIFYTYLGYPLLLFVISRFRPVPVQKTKIEDLPSVSVIIAAKNEEDRIVDRLRNLCKQDYPYKRMEIVVVSDGSGDLTVQKVEQFQLQKENEVPSIKLLNLEVSGGKPVALNKGIDLAIGDILVFADCRQSFAEDTVLHLVQNFADESVGCVSGELLFLKGQDSDIEAEMGAYWRYEKFIRKLESKTGSVVGVTGAVYAMRQSLYVPIPEETLLDDLYCPLQCYLQGKRVIFDSKATAYDTVSKDIQQEWQRKVRTLGGNWQLFSLFGAALNPVRFRLWWKFYSHKIARLLVPFLLPVVLVLSAFMDGGLYQFLFVAQVIMYLLIVLGFCSPAARSNKLVGLCYFFFILNFAAIIGWWRWIKNDFVCGWK